MKTVIDKFKRAMSSFNLYQKIACLVLAVAIPFSVSVGVMAACESPESQIPLKGTALESSSSKAPSSSSKVRSSSKGLVTVNLKLSSVEEDLEVTIVDERGNMIVGPEFKLTVRGKRNGYKKTWAVNDGFLKLTKLAGGDYTVTMEPLDGYIVPDKPLECKVEKKVQYVEIDVSDKVVDESKVDVKKEDAAYGTTPRAPAEPVKDTVEYVASSSKKEKKKVDETHIYYAPNVKDGRILDKSGKPSRYGAIIDKGDGSDGPGFLTGLIDYGEARTVSAQGLDIPVAYINGADMLKLVNLDDGSSTDGTESASDEDSSEDTPAPGEPESSSDGSTTESESSTAPSESADPSASGGSSSEESTPGSSESSSRGSSTESSSSQGSSSGETSSEGSSSQSSSSGSSSSQSSSSKPEPKEIKGIYNEDGTVKSEYKRIFDSLDIKSIEQTVKVEKEVTIYYGWQTIDGNRYYFDKKGNKVTGTQIIQGVTYVFASDGKLSDKDIVGIDVSKYQKNIDWNAVKNRGIEFVIIRAGYRGYGTGALVEDPMFRTNIAGATRAGLKVGVYIFSQAITTEEAVEEASMALSLVKGYNVAYPIFFDTEFSTSARDGRADDLSASHRTTIAKAFCETVKNAGYKPGVYASKSFFYGQLDYSQLSSYSIWVAHYTSASKTDFSHHHDIWQYTGSGSVAGVPTAVDMNIGYTPY